MFGQLGHEVIGALIAASSMCLWQSTDLSSALNTVRLVYRKRLSLGLQFKLVHLPSVTPCSRDGSVLFTGLESIWDGHIIPFFGHLTSLPARE